MKYQHQAVFIIVDVEIRWRHMDLIMISPIHKEDFGIGGSAQYEVSAFNVIHHRLNMNLNYFGTLCRISLWGIIDILKNSKWCLSLLFFSAGIECQPILQNRVSIQKNEVYLFVFGRQNKVYLCLDRG